jgi:hypothetical protein
MRAFTSASNGGVPRLCTLDLYRQYSVKARLYQWAITSG